MIIKPFISLEGLDGAGKGQAIAAIVKILEERGFSYTQTREPGGTPVAETLRDIVKHNKHNEHICIETETLLFYASRMQNINQVIKPALERGDIVISDRFNDSTLAYQSARGLDIEKIKAIQNATMGDFKPSLTLYLDIDLKTSKERVGYRNEGFDNIEKTADLFFDKARENYLQIAKEDPKRFKIINAKLPQEMVLKQVVETISNFLDLIELQNNKKKVKRFKP